MFYVYFVVLLFIKVKYKRKSATNYILITYLFVIPAKAGILKREYKLMDKIPFFKGMTKKNKNLVLLIKNETIFLSNL